MDIQTRQIELQRAGGFHNRASLKEAETHINNAIKLSNSDRKPNLSSDTHLSLRKTDILGQLSMAEEALRRVEVSEQNKSLVQRATAKIEELRKKWDSMWDGW